MQAGASIGIGLSFGNMVGAVLVSSAILTVLSCIMGVIACKSGLSFGLMARYSFGQIGTWVPVVIVAVTTIGWFSIDAFLIGDSAHRLFSWMPTMVICVLAGLGMTLTAAKGTKWMNRLSDIAVPVVLIFGFISIIKAFNDVGGIAGINNIVGGDTLTFAQAVSLGVGSYAVGSVMFTPDIMRFAKNAKTAVVVMIITIMLGNSFMVFFGAIGAVVYNDPDIMGILALQGLLAPAFLVMVLNIWSTAQGCVYSGSMSLSSVIKVPRNKLTYVFGILGTILGCLGFYNLFGDYINFLSSTVPPVVGIILADFLTKYKNGYGDMDKLPKADIGGFVAWIAGFLSTKIALGLPSINCVIVALIVKIIFNKISKK
jgi:cytosine permease